MKTTIKIMALLAITLTVITACSKDDDCTKTTWFQDADGDGFGDLNSTQQACTQPVGYVDDSTDFNDTQASAYPGAPELCNGIDDNNDGMIDENATCPTGQICENGVCVTAVTYYTDQDGDGFGNGLLSIVAGATAPADTVTDNTDCDDGDPNVFPGAPENTTDGIDNDCDGLFDECDGLTATECNCSDGIDNDQDGNTDCADSDCTGIPPC